jgi:putative oxidoreductase
MGAACLLLHKNTNKMKTIDWVFRIIVAVILGQTLYFKFTGAAESRFIFETLGAEPYGRIGSGVVELIAAVLILYPATAGLGALLSLGVISGAIMSHLAFLGIEIMGDGGLLFYLAVVVFICSAVVAWNHRRSIPMVGKWFV